jgi:site-specific DNA-cytosine methylase
MNNKMKYFSMFSGIGGFELGIKNAYEGITN